MTHRTSPHRITVWLPLLVLPVLLLSQGCGRTRWPGLVPVEGRLTLNGEPLAGKVVSLIPEESVEKFGTKDWFARAITREDGGYSMLSRLPGELKPLRGVLRGRYVVTVTELTADGDGITQATQKTAIPAPYRQSVKSKLRVDVSGKGVKADFDLQSRP